MSDYQSFLDSKRLAVPSVGFSIHPKELSDTLFPFQSAIVAWALRRGRAAVFADTGLGKTRVELEWAWRVYCHTRGGSVIILAPLAVGAQTVRESVVMGIPTTLCKTAEDVRTGINITNYERLHLFDPSAFVGIVLDESSILKSFDGATRQAIQAFAETIHYRLAATATPAPNDHMELGTHAEFLGVMTRAEMLATFFCHDGGDTAKWRLMGHAQDAFWKWMATWAVACRKPSDLGFEDAGYDLPPLKMHEHCIEAESGFGLFAEAVTMTEQRQARRQSLEVRVAKVAELVAAEPNEPWLIWCELNDEGDALTAAIPGAVQVAGSDSPESKEAAMTGFADGRVQILVSKSSICGFGMNFQHCARVAFVGVSHSFESLYQAVRRCWRFGQTRSVDVHLVYSEAESAVVRNLKRKEMDAKIMGAEMVRHMSEFCDVRTIESAARDEVVYQRDTASGRGWTLHLGDCVEVLKEMPDGSADYSIFSPPFASLYTYSNSERDMGNCRSDEEFAEHFAYAVAELYRVLRAGRLVSFHCMNLPLTKERNGVIGIRDFRGELIRLFESVGFVFHSEVCIWKDPVTAMQRTKAIGLLYKQLKKDSALSRQGIPDYLVTMRKPGINPEPIVKDPSDFSVDLWQRYASPVWMDINPSDTLQRESAREEKDERHICPLQLGVIRRAVRLWTNPGDTVLSPFAGIGSEGHAALQMGRQFVGIELKPSYWNQAIANLRNAEIMAGQATLFSDDETEAPLHAA